MVEEEYKVNPERRSVHVQVSKPGEYLISLRSQDHRNSFSDESAAYVQCHPRPLTRGPPPPIDKQRPHLCHRLKKFRARMPQLANVTAGYRLLQTGTDVILLEWDVTGHFNDNTFTDLFEIELETGPFGSKSAQTMKQTINVKPNKSGHYSYPFRLDDFSNNDSFR